MQTTETRVRRKSFTYGTSVKWEGGKKGALSGDQKPSVCFSSPPEFRGQAGVWTPEDLFVASVEMCQLLTFLALAEKASISIKGYTSSATGTLEFVDGSYRFTHIVIRPNVEIGDGVDEDAVTGLLRSAHNHCLIANSISAVIEVNPTIQRVK